MIVLGIADNHDSGAAVVINGQLLSAVNQERVDRVKSSGAFPWGAIDAALDLAGVKAREVDRIAVGTGFTPSALLRALPGLHSGAKTGGQWSPLLHAYVVYQSILRGTGLHTLEVDASARILKRRFAARPFRDPELVLLDHHRTHAQGAYRTQPRSRCLVLTLDAMGDGTTATASLGNHGQLDLLWRQSGLASVNTFYSRITEWLGFTAIRHEGKVTGLAAYATAPVALLDHLRGRLSFSRGRFSRAPIGRFERRDDPFWSVLGRYAREEVAAAAQQVLEEAATAFVRHQIAATGCGHIALAGGVFANVKLNQRIAALPEVESLWVLPHMGDGGLAVAAGLTASGSAPTALAHAFWGGDISERDAYKALKRAELPTPELGNLSPQGDVLRVAALLAEGKVVGRAVGRMEWGPRALGHRSILARPHDPSINTWLNERLRRSEFMPFAPLVRAEDAPRYFPGLDKVADAARFMTVCLDTTAEFRRLAPAAVHVDGTARPQLLHRDDDPALHALLGEVGARTGAPVLINTSFNLHEEPIVASASDAVKAMQQARLDALWIGPYVSERP